MRILLAERVRAVIFCSAFALLTGCNSILNGWLDPTIVGRFDQDVTMEVRTSLGLQDAPPGIPGECAPNADDKKLVIQEYPITAGDVLNIEIYELRDRQAPFQAQSQVTSTGFVNLPVIGRVHAADLTIPEFEAAVARVLREREILQEPQVTINGQVLQRGTYSIFGIGVSASTDAPLRAGTFPIRRPDIRVLEAINQVGGLNEFVTDVYIFRNTSSAVPHESETQANGAMRERKDPSPTESDQVQPKELDVQNHRDTPHAVRELLYAAQLRPSISADKDSGPIVESLKPPPTPPFLWVNDEWVPNPSFRRLESESDAVTPAAALDRATPAVNWSRIAGESNYRIIRLPAEGLRHGDPEYNIYIRAGDVIRVSSGEIGVYYVMGQVNRVGPFRFEAERITLKSAIATAGGLSGLAWPDRCTVYRQQGFREQLFQVNLDRIFAGKDPDFVIKRGDIINVGSHPFAPFLQRIRAWTLPNPANNVGYSFTYSRNFADIDSFSVRQNPHNEPDRFPALFP